jgi:hypothetical protein
MPSPVFSVFCIDYRFDALMAEFYKEVGLEMNYYACSTAGSALSLGYKQYCTNECHSCGCKPNNSSMVTLKRSIVDNLNIALTLSDITTVYLINHQDCGAIRAFLSCSNYPDHGQNKDREISINSKLLAYAAEYMKTKFTGKKYKLGLMDINGTVAFYNPVDRIWTVVYIGNFTDPQGLWSGLQIGDTYTVSQHAL